jgi:hypothetical protein
LGVNAVLVIGEFVMRKGRLVEDAVSGEDSSIRISVISRVDRKKRINKEGAFTGIIIDDGDPSRDIRLLMDAEKNIDLILKDGEISKNTVQSENRK